MKTHKTFADFFRIKRTEQRISLRDFCKITEADPSNISKIERGLMPPPQAKEILERYAKGLNVAIDTDDWITFSDLAAVANRIIPEDISSDKNLLELMPAFFRTLRGEKPATGELKALIAKVRKQI
jgi:transcriptional regulator with XRE-family HTH domain